MLDTHIWVWWVQGDSRLSSKALEQLDERAADCFGVSVMSCWEVAMLHSRERLELPCPLDDWLDQALKYPGVQLLQLSRHAVVDSCRLPGDFHRDPVDRMLVATARELDCPFITADEKILRYEQVATISLEDLTAT